jgi:ribosomal protein S18 acetylase RimI-like enzyme
MNAGAQNARVRIRPYRDSDELAVATLWREIFPDAPAHNQPERDIWRKLSVQRELFLVAVESGGAAERVVGTAMAGYDGHRGWLYYLSVHPSLRRQGIGRALMDRVEADLGAMGCPKLNLQVRAGNIGAVAFYRHLGFSVEERVSMGKRLASQESDESSLQE